MSTKIKNAMTPVAWLAYLAIGFEILYMISPFALYYYSTYGPGLNLLHNWPQTAWLSRFFLPHFTESSVWIFNRPGRIGWILFEAGFIIFLIGAGQIYYAKFAKKGAVTGGLYRFVRNPQYTAFAIMGFGLLLIWPRFLVLVMYVTMLFVYTWLARHEEKECAEKFGEGFKAYAASTPMFIPVRMAWLDKLPALPKSGVKRVAANLVVYLGTITLFVLAALGIRNYALTTISTFYSQEAATIATAKMSPDEMEKALQLALDYPEVKNKLAATGYGAGAKLLNYLVPLSWFLPDLPLEKLPEGVHGHHQPKTFNQDEWKVLFTKAKLVGNKSATEANIIKNAVGRIPLVVVKLNKASGEILGIETPPPHVRWGDIPTPLF